VSTPVAQRRDGFISALYALNAGLESSIPKRRAEARQVLARLRRSLVTARPEPAAYEVVFRHDPPESEQDAWILVAGLFALHPKASRRGDRSIGTAMQALQEKRGDSATRRFEQLLGRDRAGLPHHLRQIVRLLAAEGIPVNYAALLDDLVVLMGDKYSEETAHRIRLRWARDFHRKRKTTTTDNGEPAPAPTTVENPA